MLVGVQDEACKPEGYWRLAHVVRHTLYGELSDILYNNICIYAYIHIFNILYYIIYRRIDVYIL
jgi:hypothetical protein